MVGKTRGIPAHLTPEAHALRKWARQETGRLMRAGEIVRQPCMRCGAERVEMHHLNYADPRAIAWLCRPHHLEVHDREWRTVGGHGRKPSSLSPRGLQKLMAVPERKRTLEWLTQVYAVVDKDRQRLLPPVRRRRTVQAA
jgi:hypothetical protein